MTSHAKDITLYISWCILLVISVFRYQLWHVFDQKYCSENNLLAVVGAVLKPDNWLLIAVFVLAILAIVRIYNWADNRWLWFSHYGHLAAVGILFVGLSLISWSCG